MKTSFSILRSNVRFSISSMMMIYLLLQIVLNQNNNNHHNFFISTCTAQRFLRQGFSNNEDFGAEMKSDDDSSSNGNSNNVFDMTREMFIIQDLNWQIQSPLLQSSSTSSSTSTNTNTILQRHISDPILRQHIQQYIHPSSIDLRLLKKRGKYGLRAIGRISSTNQKLRAFWRQSILPPSSSSGIPPPPSSTTTTTNSRGIDLLKASYDDACRSRLFTVEFELQLPPLKKNNKKLSFLTSKNRSSSNNHNNNNNILPSIIYQVSLEPGSMNPKAMVPRSAGRVYILPYGRSKAPTKSSSSNNSSNYGKFEIGKAYISAAPMKSGIIDPSWAKGRAIFRKGRNSGLM